MHTPKSRYIVTALLAGALMGAATASAQYNQDISVEGKYVPEYIPQDRIGVFPQPVKFPLEKSALAYATDGVNADFKPVAVPITATGWNDTHRFRKERGYVDFDLGRFLQADISAGYRFVENKNTVAGVRLQHNSTSLGHAFASDFMDKVRVQYYDEVIGVYCSHLFDGKGRLDAAADYHFGHYNYYGYNPFYFTPDMEAPKEPWQTLNDAAARVSWQSPAELDNLSYHASAGVRYFGMWRFFLPGVEAATLLPYTGCRETDVDLAAGVYFPVNASSTLGLDLDSHILTYSQPQGRGAIHKFPAAFEYPDTYGTLSLTPWYGYNLERLAIRVGARVDLMFNGGVKGDRYRVFNIAPDVRVDYDAGPVKMFLHVGGGNRLHTLASMYQTDYYTVPAIFSSAPAYSPISSKLGFEFGPFSGFSAGLDLSYNYTQNQPFYGWYQAILNGPAARHNMGLPFEVDGRKVSYFREYESSADLHGISIAARASYDSGRYFRIDASASYQPQKGKTGFFNGMDRAKWVVGASVSSNPWRSLKLNLSCDYRGGRAFPIYAYFDEAAPGADATEAPGKTLVMYKVKDSFSLNFSASYQITDKIGVWLQIDNLTNRINILEPAMTLPGTVPAVGMNFIF